MDPNLPLHNEAGIARVFDAARNADFDIALMELGRFAHGEGAYLAHGNQCLRSIAKPVLTLDSNGQAVSEICESIKDVVMAELDLEWVRFNTCYGHSRAVLVGALALRAGLLANILDQSFQHLEGRESGGDLILRQQLVKASFVKSYCVAMQILAEAPLLLQEGVEVDFALLHQEISTETNDAARLMGGHGFLVGGVNTTEMLSFCVAAVYGPSADLSAANLASNGLHQYVAECVQ